MGLKENGQRLFTWVMLLETKKGEIVVSVTRILTNDRHYLGHVHRFMRLETRLYKEAGMYSVRIDDKDGDNIAIHCHDHHNGNSLLYFMNISSNEQAVQSTVGLKFLHRKVVADFQWVSIMNKKFLFYVTKNLEAFLVDPQGERLLFYFKQELKPLIGLGYVFSRKVKDFATVQIFNVNTESNLVLFFDKNVLSLDFSGVNAPNVQSKFSFMKFLALNSLIGVQNLPEEYEIEDCRFAPYDVVQDQDMYESLETEMRKKQTQVEQLKTEESKSEQEDEIEEQNDQNNQSNSSQGQGQGRESKSMSKNSSSFFPEARPPQIPYDDPFQPARSKSEVPVKSKGGGWFSNIFKKKQNPIAPSSGQSLDNSHRMNTQMDESYAQSRQNLHHPSNKSSASSLNQPPKNHSLTPQYSAGNLYSEPKRQSHPQISTTLEPWNSHDNAMNNQQNNNLMRQSQSLSNFPKTTGLKSFEMKGQDDGPIRPQDLLPEKPKPISEQQPAPINPHNAEIKTIPMPRRGREPANNVMKNNWHSLEPVEDRIKGFMDEGPERKGGFDIKESENKVQSIQPDRDEFSPMIQKRTSTWLTETDQSDIEVASPQKRLTYLTSANPEHDNSWISLHNEGEGNQSFQKSQNRLKALASATSKPNKSINKQFTDSMWDTLDVQDDDELSIIPSKPSQSAFTTIEQDSGSMSPIKPFQKAQFQTKSNPNFLDSHFDEPQRTMDFSSNIDPLMNQSPSPIFGNQNTINFETQERFNMTSVGDSPFHDTRGDLASYSTGNLVNNDNPPSPQQEVKRGPNKKISFVKKSVWDLDVTENSEIMIREDKKRGLEEVKTFDYSQSAASQKLKEVTKGLNITPVPYEDPNKRDSPVLTFRENDAAGGRDQDLDELFKREPKASRRQQEAKNLFGVNNRLDTSDMMLEQLVSTPSLGQNAKKVEFNQEEKLSTFGRRSEEREKPYFGEQKEYPEFGFNHGEKLSTFGRRSEEKKTKEDEEIDEVKRLLDELETINNKGNELISRKKPEDNLKNFLSPAVDKPKIQITPPLTTTSPATTTDHTRPHVDFNKSPFEEQPRRRREDDLSNKTPEPITKTKEEKLTETPWNRSFGDSIVDALGLNRRSMTKETPTQPVVQPKEEEKSPEFENKNVLQRTQNATKGLNFSPPEKGKWPLSNEKKDLQPIGTFSQPPRPRDLITPEKPPDKFKFPLKKDEISTGKKDILFQAVSSKVIKDSQIVENPPRNSKLADKLTLGNQSNMFFYDEKTHLKTEGDSSSQYTDILDRTKKEPFKPQPINASPEKRVRTVQDEPQGRSMRSSMTFNESPDRLEKLEGTGFKPIINEGFLERSKTKIEEKEDLSGKKTLKKMVGAEKIKGIVEKQKEDIKEGKRQKLELDMKKIEEKSEKEEGGDKEKEDKKEGKISFPLPMFGKKEPEKIIEQKEKREPERVVEPPRLEKIPSFEKKKSEPEMPIPKKPFKQIQKTTSKEALTEDSNKSSFITEIPTKSQEPSEPIFQQEKTYTKPQEAIPPEIERIDDIPTKTSLQLDPEKPNQTLEDNPSIVEQQRPPSIEFKTVSGLINNSSLRKSIEGGFKGSRRYRRASAEDSQELNEESFVSKKETYERSPIKPPYNISMKEIDDKQDTRLETEPESQKEKKNEERLRGLFDQFLSSKLSNIKKSEVEPEAESEKVFNIIEESPKIAGGKTKIKLDDQVVEIKEIVENRNSGRGSVVLKEKFKLEDLKEGLRNSSETVFERRSIKEIKRKTDIATTVQQQAEPATTKERLPELRKSTESPEKSQQKKLEIRKSLQKTNFQDPKVTKLNIPSPQDTKGFVKLRESKNPLLTSKDSHQDVQTEDTLGKKSLAFPTITGVRSSKNLPAQPPAPILIRSEAVQVKKQSTAQAAGLKFERINLKKTNIDVSESLVHSTLNQERPSPFRRPGLKAYVRGLIDEEAQYETFCKILRKFSKIPEQEGEGIRHMEDIVRKFQDEYQQEVSDALGTKVCLLFVHNLIRIFLRLKQDVNSFPRKYFIRLASLYYTIKRLLSSYLINTKAQPTTTTSKLEGRGGSLRRSLNIRNKSQGAIPEEGSEGMKKQIEYEEIDKNKVFKRLIKNLNEQEDLSMIKVIKCLQQILSNQTMATQLAGTCLFFFLNFLKNIIFSVLDNQPRYPSVPSLLHKDALVHIWDQKKLPEIEKYLTFCSTKVVEYDKKILRKDQGYAVLYKELNLTNLMLYMVNFLNYPRMYLDIAQHIIKNSSSDTSQTMKYLALFLVILRDKRELFTNKIETIKVSRVNNNGKTNTAITNLSERAVFQKSGDEIKEISYQILDLLIQSNYLLDEDSHNKPLQPSHLLSVPVLLTEINFLSSKTSLFERALYKTSLPIQNIIKSLNKSPNNPFWIFLLNNTQSSFQPQWLTVTLFKGLETLQIQDTPAPSDLDPETRDKVHIIMRSVYELAYFLNYTSFVQNAEEALQAKPYLAMLYKISKLLYYIYLKIQLYKLQFVPNKNQVIVKTYKGVLLANILAVKEYEAFEDFKIIQKELNKILEELSEDVQLIKPDLGHQINWILKTVNSTQGEYQTIVNKLEKVAMSQDIEGLDIRSEESITRNLFPKKFVVNKKKPEDYIESPLFDIFLDKVLSLQSGGLKAATGKLFVMF